MQSQRQVASKLPDPTNLIRRNCCFTATRLAAALRRTRLTHGGLFKLESLEASARVRLATSPKRHFW